MKQILLVGIGGFFGALARYGLAQLIRAHSPHPFPIATLFINFAGCIGVGFLFQFLKDHPLFPSLTLFIAVGFLGAFTTFSTFSFETMDLIKRDHSTLAVFNIIVSVLLCLGGVLFGDWLGRVAQ